MKVTLVGGNGVVSLGGSVGDGSWPTHGGSLQDPNRIVDLFSESRNLLTLHSTGITKDGNSNIRPITNHLVFT